MKATYIKTLSTIQADEAIDEVEGPGGLIGPSLVIVVSPPGRGKTEWARHRATNSSAIYISPMNIRTGPMVLREIAFQLCKVRPARSDACLTIISEEMNKERRTVIVDEADLLAISILEMLRNMGEVCGCPIVLIGEETLKGKIATRRRISSRVRRQVEFSPVTQPDILLFFKNALELDIPPKAVALIHRHSQGDWRPVLVVGIAIERAVRASGLSEVPEKLVKEIIAHES